MDKCLNNILLVGDFLSGTGYSQAIQNYALALDHVGVNVVCRYVRMTPQSKEINPKIKEFLDRPVDNIDVVFNYNLPDQYAFKSGFLNAGGFAYETTDLPVAQWSGYLDTMDRIIVPCSFQNKFGQLKKWQNKVRIVPHAINTEKFNKKWTKLTFGESENTFKFYTISEFNRRKNLEALILAYISEFDQFDDCVLIIKTHIPGANKDQNLNIVRQKIEEIKKGCGRFADTKKYPKIVLVTSFVSEEEVNSIHQSCDCFITSSRGESFCYPAFDSLGFGNKLIASKTGAMEDFLAGQDFVDLIDGHYSQCFGNEGLPGYYSANEKWFNVDISDLREKMKSSYESRLELRNNKKSDEQLRFIEESFGYKTIGNLLKNVLLEGIQ